MHEDCGHTFINGAVEEKCLDCSTLSRGCFGVQRSGKKIHNSVFADSTFLLLKSFLKKFTFNFPEAVVGLAVAPLWYNTMPNERKPGAASHTIC